jgi:uncharacterized protein involved in exopolysaccharide biosynthesis
MSARWRLFAGLLVVVLFAAVGAVAGYILAGRIQRPYTASVQVRAAVADGSCVAFSCPTLSPGPNGIPYVLDQVNIAQGSTIARQVADSLRLSAVVVSPAVLQNHIRAREVGGSSTMTLAYTDPSKDKAAAIARVYGQEYVDYANATAVKALAPLTSAIESRLPKAPPSQRADLSTELDRLEIAIAAYKAGYGPNGAEAYADVPTVTRGGISRSGWSLLGAAIAGLLGVALVMTFTVRSAGRDPSVAPPSASVHDAELAAEQT